MPEAGQPCPLVQGDCFDHLSSGPLSIPAEIASNRSQYFHSCGNPGKTRLKATAVQTPITRYVVNGKANVQLSFLATPHVCG